MNHGFGLGSAKNLSRIFSLIASKEIPDIRYRSTTGGAATPRNEGAGSRRSRATADARAVPGALSGGAPSVPTPEPTVTVLRYFLDQGRLAELRIPPDMDDREKLRLFAHLRIDLLDEVPVQ